MANLEPSLHVTTTPDERDSKTISTCQKVPRRILHFSDGTLEEYSTDEDEADAKKSNQVAAVDPKALTWMPWVWYQAATAGSRTLEVCDYLGESLANFFGITTPKYQFEIDEYHRAIAEEREAQKKMDLEMGGWASPSPQDNESVKSQPSPAVPATMHRY